MPNFCVKFAYFRQVYEHFLSGQPLGFFSINGPAAFKSGGEIIGANFQICPGTRINEKLTVINSILP